MSPSISVIVPIYNTAKYLAECVDSILNQDLREIEIILVDDGSTDDCPMICDHYAALDSRIMAIHKPNGGLSSARNAGLDNAHGKYISFVDSDDRIENHMLSEMLNLAEAETADVIACSLTRFEGEKILGKISPPNKRHNVVYSGDEFKIVVAALLGKFHFSKRWRNRYVCNKLFRRDIIKNTRFENIALCEDAVFLFESYRFVKKYIETPKALYFYRKTTTSITQNCGEKLWDAGRFLAELFYSKGKSYYPWIDARWIANMLVRSLLDAITSESKSCTLSNRKMYKIYNLSISYHSLLREWRIYPSSLAGIFIHLITFPRSFFFPNLIQLALGLKRTQGKI